MRLNEHKPAVLPTTRWVTWLICSVLRHWLALVLTTLMIFVTVPFLAPVAMASGWPDIGRLIYLLYAPFCHQLPQRSWFLFGDSLTYTVEQITSVTASRDAWHLRHFLGTPTMGWKVAWSDRMISFYCMTPVFGLIYAVLRQGNGVIQPRSLTIMILSLLPLVLDGTTHLVNDLFSGVTGGGFRDTNAWLAFLTVNAFPGFYAGDHFGTFNWWMRVVTGLLAAWGSAFTVFPWLDEVIGEEVARSCDCNPEDPKPLAQAGQ